MKRLDGLWRGTVASDTRAIGGTLMVTCPAGTGLRAVHATSVQGISALASRTPVWVMFEQGDPSHPVVVATGAQGDLIDHQVLVADHALLAQTAGELRALGINTQDYPRLVGETDDTARLNRATAAAVAANIPLLLTEFQYTISATLDWRIDSLKVIGNTPLLTRIVQTTNNIPIVQFGGAFQYLSGILFKYNTPQDGRWPNANAAELWHPNLGRYERLRFQAGYRCLYLPQVNANGIGGNTVFSCSFDTIELYGYFENAMECKSFGANSTGNHFSNIYTHNNFNTSHDASEAGVVLLTDFDETVWNQLNVEWCAPGSYPVRFVRCGNMVINSLHIEEIQMPGGTTALGFIRISDATHLLLNGVTWVNTVVGAGTGVRSLFSVGGASAGEKNRLIAHGVRERGTTVSATTFSVVDFDTDSTGANSVEIKALDTSGTNAVVTNDGKAMARVGNAGLPTGGGTISQGAGVPTKPGLVNPTAGDIYFRTDTPSTAGQRVYICTTGGATPVWSGIV